MLLHLSQFNLEFLSKFLEILLNELRETIVSESIGNLIDAVDAGMIRKYIPC